MRHLGQDIKRPIAAVGKTEDRGTRATLSIFKGAVKRTRPLQSTWNTVEPESWCCPYFHPPCLSQPIKPSPQRLTLPTSLLLLGMDGSVPPCPLGTLVWLRRRGLCGHSIWQGQPPHARNNAVYILQHRANRERRFYWTLLKEPHECKQTGHCRLDPLNEGSCLI